MIQLAAQAIRQHFRVSQTGVQRILKLNGYYTRISERGKRIPTMLVLLAYARAVKIPREQIIDDELELTF